MSLSTSPIENYILILHFTSKRFSFPFLAFHISAPPAAIRGQQSSLQATPCAEKEHGGCRCAGGGGGADG